MIAHKEMLAAAELLVIVKNENEFSIQEIIDVLKSAGSKYKENTIRAEMLRCCINCPRDNETPHDYFERKGDGKFQLILKS
jgi:hypothetical protein